jgi:abhydrolase domain-containing protein 12
VIGYPLCNYVATAIFCLIRLLFAGNQESYSPTYHVEIFDAQDDPIVPWSFSNEFFAHAVSAAKGGSIDRDEFKKMKAKKIFELGQRSWYVEWPTSNGLIRQEVLQYGVHDRIMMHPQIAMAVIRAFWSPDSLFPEQI